MYLLGTYSLGKIGDFQWVKLTKQNCFLFQRFLWSWEGHELCKVISWAVCNTCSESHFCPSGPGQHFGASGAFYLLLTKDPVGQGLYFKAHVFKYHGNTVNNLIKLFFLSWMRGHNLAFGDVAFFFPLETSFQISVWFCNKNTRNCTEKAAVKESTELDLQSKLRHLFQYFIVTDRCLEGRIPTTHHLEKPELCCCWQYCNIPLNHWTFLFPFTFEAGLSWKMMTNWSLAISILNVIVYLQVMFKVGVFCILM